MPVEAVIQSMRGIIEPTLKTLDETQTEKLPALVLTDRQGPGKGPLAPFAFCRGASFRGFRTQGSGFVDVEKLATSCFVQGSSKVPKAAALSAQGEPAQGQH